MRFSPIAVCALAAFAASCFAAPVARIGDVYYDDLRDAMMAGGDIVLVADAIGDCPGKVQWRASPATNRLDLAGHSIVGTNSECAVIEPWADHLTIMDSVGGGVITRTVPKNGNGGGIINRGTLIFAGGTIRGCAATDMGGGIFNYGNVQICGGTIENCSASSGGGIANNGGFNNVPGTLQITAGLISNCSASKIGGGACTTHAMTISGGVIRECSAGSNGSALYLACRAQHKCEITGGAIAGTYYAYRGTTHSITGGIFDDGMKASPHFQAAIASGYKVSRNTSPESSQEFPWQVKEIGPPAGTVFFISAL